MAPCRSVVAAGRRAAGRRAEAGRRVVAPGRRAEAEADAEAGFRPPGRTYVRTC